MPPGKFRVKPGDLPQEVSAWDGADVANWLIQVGMPEIATLFRVNGIDGEALPVGR